MNDLIIYKYPLDPTPNQVVSMPKMAVIVSCKIQHGIICVWAMVDKRVKETQDQEFMILGTGWPILDEKITNHNFVDTVIDGEFVWHVFKKNVEWPSREEQRRLLNP